MQIRIGDCHWEWELDLGILDLELGIDIGDSDRVFGFGGGIEIGTRIGDIRAGLKTRIVSDQSLSCRFS